LKIEKSEKVVSATQTLTNQNYRKHVLIVLKNTHIV